MKIKLDKYAIALELSSSLLPKTFRSKHKKHINIRYCSPGHDYLFQDMSVNLFSIFYTVFWGIISNYIYDLCKNIKRANTEAININIQDANENIVEYKRLISKAKGRKSKIGRKLSVELRNTIKAHEKALKLLENPQPLKNNISKSLRKIRKRLQK